MTPGKRRTYLMPGCAVLLGSIVILTLLFMNNIRTREHQGHLFINTTKEVQASIFEFRLWFEEYISGDRKRSMEEILALLDTAESKLNLMIDGGITSHGTLLRPAVNLPVVGFIKGLEETLDILRESTSSRITGINSALGGAEHGFDNNFYKFIRDARGLEAHFIENDKPYILRSNRTSVIVVIIWALAVSMVTIGLTLLERKRAGAVEALRRSEDDLSTILKNVGEGIIKLDSSFTILLVNEEFCNIFGYSEDELIGEELSVILPREHREVNIYGVWQNTGKSPFGVPGKRVEMKGLHRDGTVFPIELRTDKLMAAAAEEFYTCVIRNISERRQLVESLRDLSYFDELTSIANRRSHDKNLITEWNRAKRRNTPISIIMVDIDYFKNYNDYYGHAAGDECLRRVAQALQSIIVRAGDSIARYGGEEFSVILPGSNLASASYLAESMRKKIESLKIEHAGSKVSKYVTISLGAASAIPADDGYPEALVSAADDALYNAKDAGRNRVEVRNHGLQSPGATVTPIRSVR